MLFSLLDLFIYHVFIETLGFPGSSAAKEFACKVEDPGSIPGSGRSPEKEHATHSSILGLPW